MQAFASNPDVSFGDVNLSKDSIRGAPHNPGQGGWPTVRYFNKDTGYGGANYNKKTSKAMCDELGDDKYMQAYVEEAGKTSLCSAETGSGCSDKEKKYAEQWKVKPVDKVTAQITRLEGMTSKKMTQNLKTWVIQRLAILKQIKKAGDHDEL